MDWMLWYHSHLRAIHLRYNLWRTFYWDKITVFAETMSRLAVKMSNAQGDFPPFRCRIRLFFYLVFGVFMSFRLSWQMVWSHESMKCEALEKPVNMRMCFCLYFLEDLDKWMGNWRTGGWKLFIYNLWRICHIYCCILSCNIHRNCLQK